MSSDIQRSVSNIIKSAIRDNPHLQEEFKPITEALKTPAKISDSVLERNLKLMVMLLFMNNPMNMTEENKVVLQEIIDGMSQLFDKQPTPSQRITR